MQQMMKLKYSFSVTSNLHTRKKDLSRINASIIICEGHLIWFVNLLFPFYSLSKWNQVFVKFEMAFDFYFDCLTNDTKFYFVVSNPIYDLETKYHRIRNIDDCNLVAIGYRIQLPKWTNELIINIRAFRD